MRLILIFVIISLFVASPLGNAIHAQQRKSSFHLAFLHHHNSFLHSQGYLYKLKDSSILFMPKESYLSDNSNLITYPVSDIDIIDISVKAPQGMIIGAISGFALGAIIGSFIPESNDFIFDWERGDWTLPLGIMVGVIGIAIGKKSYHSKKTVRIQGDQNAYVKNRDLLERYVLQY